MIEYFGKRINILSQQKPLTNRSFIDNYLVKNVLFFSKDTIVYITEDMKLGKKFIITEFFPQDICHRSDDGHSIVILDRNGFDDKKELFLENIKFCKTYKDMNIMKFITTFEMNDTVYMVNEYKDETPFKAYLESKDLDALDVIVLFKPIFAFITSLHNLGNIHGNIHALNMFVDKKGNLFLSQVANVYPGIYKHYTSPELYTDLKKMTIKSDIYALGALLYEAINGFPPVDAKDRENALLRGESDTLKLLEIQDGHFKAFYEFINQALSMSPEKRPSSLMTLQSLIQKKKNKQKKEPLEVLEGDNPKRTSMLHLIGIVLISSVVYAFIVDTSAVKVSQNEISQLDVLRYRWAAYWGDSKAQNALGTLYAKGLYVEQDRKKSIEWYQKSANQGDINAMISLSRVYEKGLGVPKDRDKALEYLEQAGEEEGLSSQRNMAYNYYAGRGVEKDPDKAFELAMKAAKRNDTYSMALLGTLYYKGIGTKKDYTLSVQWYRKAAKAGDAYAAYRLGYAYEYKKGLKKDVKQAMNWYKTSADRGNKSAMTRLGKKYYFGFKDDKTHIKRDLEKARHWFNKSSELNNSTADKYLAKIDKEEDPSEIRRQRDKRIKKEILSKASNNKYNIKKNNKTEFILTMKRAKNNHPTSMRLLAHMYLKGIGTQINNDQAILWLKKAVESGDPQAGYDLGQIYLFGGGVKNNGKKGMYSNIKKAMHWYQISADRGYPPAMFRLGLQYYYGYLRIVKVNLYKSHYWFKKASEHNIKDADKFLEKINKKL